MTNQTTPSPHTNVRTLQARLTALKAAVTATSPEAREALLREREEIKLALEVALVHARKARDAEAATNRMRTFAGFGTPLHEAIIARLPPNVVAELEAAAEATQRLRNKRMAERRAAKTANGPPTPAVVAPRPPSTNGSKAPVRRSPEVYYAARSSGERKTS